jgi:mRNA-degrading endonuclease RelE of RelBE toxin-antitoxin system
MFRVKVLPRAESQLVKIQKNIQIKIVAFIDNLEVTYYPNK